MTSLMPTLVVNLESRPDRLERFTTVNSFLSDAERLPAVNGHAVNRARMLEVGLIAPTLECTPGALGCALSHVVAWQRAVTDNKPVTIFEDDAVVHAGFQTLAPQVISQLPQAWDIISWGWNFDAPLVIELLPGVGSGAIHCNQDMLRKNLNQFQALALQPRPVRMLAFCGTLGYTVSPRGAGKLIGGCIPLSPLPGLIDRRTGKGYYGIDLAMSALCQHMHAYACIPPLTVTPNDDSSIQ
ncbi:MAG TPA: glycosyltransferase family 25 protein [Steroidobacteraceae bacterium]|jgi:GR25 family glycosyltransferase involved in LPS biosynthesis|nr:glycosyltransferase family 25 protein [Steroidobacteraceae bacterium]